VFLAKFFYERNGIILRAIVPNNNAKMGISLPYDGIEVVPVDNQSH